jgi:hypothetical protein
VPTDDYLHVDTQLQPPAATVSSAVRRYAALRGGLIAAVVAAGFVGVMGSTTVAWAQGPIADSDIDGQCGSQYPAGGGYLKGVAYLAPPGDAYSWRCRQAAVSDSGVTITDLAVDLGALCATYGGGRPSAALVTDPSSWSCA